MFELLHYCYIVLQSHGLFNCYCPRRTA